MTDDGPKRTPEDLMRALREYEKDADVEAVLAMSPDEVDRELRASGLDPEAVNAMGRATAEAALAKVLERMGPPVPPAPTSAPGAHGPHEPAIARDAATAGPPVPGAATSLALAILGVVALVIIALIVVFIGPGRQAPRPHDTVVPSTDASARPTEETSPDRLIAKSLREDATRACAKTEWAACLDALEDARRLDPAGEETPLVKVLRKAARDGLRQDKAPPRDDKAPPRDDKGPH